MALRSAIATSGLGLDRIQARLQDHGIAISVTALSYWQSGKRQPERQGSISAVRALEEILEVPTGSLLGLLPPPRPRGTSSRRLHEDAGRAPLSLDRQPDVTLVGLHDHCVVTEEDQVSRSTVTAKAVFRAQADAQDRWLLAYRQDGLAPRAAGAGGAPGIDAVAPVLSAVRNCTVGRIEEDGDSGLTLAELLFSRPIDTGETHLMEYALTYRHDPDSTARKAHFREFWKSIPEYLLEIDFESAHPPEQCWRYSHRNNGGAAESHDLTVDEHGRVHAIATNFGPGVFGIGWI
ncbi:hypothetical protein BJF85_21760 [Saccharomonospora sp. CUA-673]|uniref:hypothetical protein n=1 Tax=Saccharomonospora sp. CUA-673 TaxID=1904969 RepID=UPI00095BAB4D|nr:hypothetical protein [Saccharomonospora sp. CUA-673]OLT43636.1 hypothetical protein BJF85_21760 [Saccharomonospora sp. CUA-673]